MRLALALFLGILVSSNASLRQEIAQQQSKLVHRYDVSCGYSCAQELAIDLGGVYGKNPDDMIAVRFCSKDTFPVALSTSASAYAYAISILESSYGYSPDRLLLLRSEDCLGPKRAVTATEFWVIPKDKSFPSSNESAKYSRVHIESLTPGGPLENASAYNEALRNSSATLRARAGAVVVVVGYYYQKPSRYMKRRLLEVGRALHQSGVQPNRYFVRLSPWTGERSIEPPEREPTYPSFFIVEIGPEKPTAATNTHLR